MHLELSLAIFCSMLVLVLGGLGIPGMGSKPSIPLPQRQGPKEEDIDRILYPCYRDANCGLGKEAQVAMGKCLDKFPRKDQDQILKTMANLGHTVKLMGSTSVRVVTHDYFCFKTKKVMKEVFTQVVRDLIAYLSKTCPTNPGLCTSSDDAIQCIMERITKHQEMEECFPED